MMVKKILLALLLFAGLLFSGGRANAADQVTIYFFWGQGCPHCEHEKEFLSGLQSEYPQIAVRDFEVWQNADNRQILIDIGNKLGIEIAGVPFTVVGDKHFIGWYDENSTGMAIEEAVKKAIDSGCSDIVAPIVNPEIDPGENGSCGDDGKTEIPEKINVPFLGAIGVKDFSLPVLAVVLGALDGFNPCAMWTLLFLISLLLGCLLYTSPSPRDRG